MPFEHRVTEYMEWFFGDPSQVRLLDSSTWASIGFLWAAAGIVLLLSVLAPFLWFLIAVVKHGPSEGFYLVAKSIYGAVTEDLPGFSLRRTLAVAKVAVQEAIRNRVLVGFVVFVLLMLFAGLFLDVENSNRAKTYISLVLTATNYLVMLMALFLSAFSLPNDIKNKTIYTVVTKPIRASEIVLGRVVGFTGVGTVMLLMMGVVSYIFVVRGMAHSHDLPADSFQAVLTKGKEGAKTALPIKEGLTSRDAHHRHRVIMDKEGNVFETEIEDGHFHRIETIGTGSERTYQVGPPRGDLIARAPVFGKLRLLDPGGNVSQGINVGNEWTYRGYIEGGNNRAAAVWTFRNITEDRYPNGLPLELNLSVFRTYKGDIEKGVLGEITLRNPNPDAKIKASPPIPFESREFVAHRMDIKRQREVGKNPDGSPQYIDIFNDLTYNGEIEVSIRCVENSQYFGVAQPDVYLRPRDSLFFMNFAKGYLSIWLQMVLVTSFGVMFSTFLSGPVAMMATLCAIGLGFFGSFARDILNQVVTGGGPIESLIRIVTQKNTQSDLDVFPIVDNIIKWTDTAFLGAVHGLTFILPNYAQFDTSLFVASGYNVYPALVGQQLTMALLYAGTASIAAYFFLKTREIAG